MSERIKRPFLLPTCSRIVVSPRIRSGVVKKRDSQLRSKWHGYKRVAEQFALKKRKYKLGDLVAMSL